MKHRHSAPINATERNNQRGGTEMKLLLTICFNIASKINIFTIYNIYNFESLYAI